MGPYLMATNENLAEAIRLYQWNIELSGAVYEALHVVEVVLRNAMDTQLATWNAAQHDAAGRQHSADWLTDPAQLLIRLADKDIKQAAERARKALNTGRPGGRTSAHPDILAQLNFGTWRYLLPSKDPGRRRLWTDALQHAFPHLTTPPRHLVDHVDGIYRLRNRVAHLEPLHAPGVVQRNLTAMRAVLWAVDPIAETWFTSRQRITTILKARPR